MDEPGGHPRRYDPVDPLYQRVRQQSLALPEADEKISHGHPAFFTTKVFCYYGASFKVDGQWRQHPRSVVVKVEPDDHAALAEDTRCYLPSYWGTRGWIGLDLREDSDWDEVAELLEDSFRLTAPRRAVTALDRRAP